MTEALAGERQLKLIVMMPLRDDWLSAAELLRRLDRHLAQQISSWTPVLKILSIDILLIDDGSIERCDNSDFQGDFALLRSIQVLRLRRNLGHQRAIAIGLAHIHQHLSCDAVLVMDADGEDTPEGVVRLLQAYGEDRGSQVIFAQRARRSESLLFRCFYHLYRTLHRWLTGVSVRVGNFSIVSAQSLDTLVAMSELWNHYAAAVFRSKLPFQMTPIARGRRIAGTSRMNFTSLVSHGLSAISVFADVVGVRLLVASIAGSILSGLGILAVVAIRVFTQRAVPGWATDATGVLAIIMMQFLTIAASFTFFMLSNRTSLGFVPFRDYSLFVSETTEIYVKETTEIQVKETTDIRVT